MTLFIPPGSKKTPVPISRDKRRKNARPSSNALTCFGQDLTPFQNGNLSFCPKSEIRQLFLPPASAVEIMKMVPFSSVCLFVSALTA